MVADYITQASSIFDALSDFIPKAIGFASVAAALLPKPDGDGILSKVHKFINAVAFNFMNATNKQ